MRPNFRCQLSCGMIDVGCHFVPKAFLIKIFTFPGIAYLSATCTASYCNYHHMVIIMCTEGSSLIDFNQYLIKTNIKSF